jgi:hypothetical protein
VKRQPPRGLLLALTASLALAATSVVSAALPSDATEAADRLVESIKKHRADAWHWQRVMGKRRSKPSFAERRTNDLERLTAIRVRWTRRANHLKDRAHHPPHRAAWLCIHRHEGRWKDPQAPYYGGLQMSRSFQRAYGRYLFRLKGTANHWTPVEQMWTAERAHQSGAGFYPWPNTAAACGLL